MKNEEYYAQRDVVDRYDDWRFGSAGGRYVNDVELSSVRELLDVCISCSSDADAKPLRAVIERSGFADRVSRRGIVSVQTALEQLDALVLPYRTLLSTTLYPSLVLEAELARCPLVTTRVPDLMPALDDRSPSLTLAEPRDPRSLADALLHVRARGTFAPFLARPRRTQIAEKLLELYGSIGRLSRGGTS